MPTVWADTVSHPVGSKKLVQVRMQYFFSVLTAIERVSILILREVLTRASRKLYCVDIHGGESYMPWRQALITNYFKPVNGQFTNTTFEDSVDTILATMSAEYKYANTRVDVDENGNCQAYLVLLAGDVLVGHLDLIEIDGSYWINNVGVRDSAQRCGIGTKMYRAAHAKLNEPIYASRGHKNEDTDDDDTRHLSVEGAALVNSLIRNGHMNGGWLR